MKFFDLDGTITPSRQKVQPHVKKALLDLNEPIVVISGLPKDEMIDHLDGIPAIILAQQGNDAPDWQNRLTYEEINEVKKYLANFVQFSIHLVYDDTQETLQNRGGLVAFSFTGHYAPYPYKYAFDPHRHFRKWILEKYPFKSETLEVQISGSTTIDFTRKNWKKGDNLKRYMELHDIDPKDCVYYGDALTPGANDESVIGIMKCVEVKNPDDLITKL